MSAENSLKVLHDVFKNAQNPKHPRHLVDLQFDLELFVDKDSILSSLFSIMRVVSYDVEVQLI